MLKISGLTIIRSETFKMLKEMRMENRFIYNQVLLRIGTMSESFMGQKISITINITYILHFIL